jgi:hypothetical protein
LDVCTKTLKAPGQIVDQSPFEYENDVSRPIYAFLRRCKSKPPPPLKTLGWKINGCKKTKKLKSLHLMCKFNFGLNTIMEFF